MRPIIRRILLAAALRLERLAGGRAVDPDRPAELDRMTLRGWLRRHQREIIFRSCRWMGHPAMKNPLDAWIFQEIIAEVRPEVVVEIGSHAGGSTLFLANVLDARSTPLASSRSETETRSSPSTREMRTRSVALSNVTR